MTASQNPDGPTRRERIMQAAFALFMEKGYAATSTLAIASRARVSKRDLYAEFAAKHDIAAACIETRATAMRAPLALPAPTTRAELVAILTRFGIALRQGIADPAVIAASRLAVQEAPAGGEFAQLIDAGGRQPSFAATVAFVQAAQANRLLAPGAPEPVAETFLCRLVGDMMLQHLLGLAPPETADLSAAHAAAAIDILLRLYTA